MDECKPLERGAALSAMPRAAPPAFTDLRFSPAQRKKGTYAESYCTIGRGWGLAYVVAGHVLRVGWISSQETKVPNASDHLYLTNISGRPSVQADARRGRRG